MKQRIYTLIIIAASIIFFTGCAKEESVIHFPNAEINNIDDSKLFEAIKKAEQDKGILSLIVYRNKDIIVEKYFGNNAADSLHPTKSVTKSVTGILLGMAIDRGFIKNPDETVGDYLSEYLAPEDTIIAKVTIRDLLTMTGGFDWNELTDPTWEYWNNWVRSDDHFIYSLHVPIIHEPGSYFTYCTTGCQLLSGIFTEATGYSLKAFAEEFLFTPIGIIGDRPWGADLHGFNYGGVTLNLSALDMLKIGELYLNNGDYKGQQIVSEEWVSSSSSPQVNTNNTMHYGEEYGFLWWIGEQQGINYYFANGYGGQFIFIFNELNLIIVAQSELNNDYYDSGQQWMNTISIIMDDILNAVEFN
ncbi:MAG: beta-lactamase family protein [Bacteroidales bacterium]|nr:beta-lactamase family protein [Bacteroidales bacterium]MCF8391871.1 beta-lactamase family protein [Bacteroidales bacterium]